MKFAEGVGRISWCGYDEAVSPTLGSNAKSICRAASDLANQQSAATARAPLSRQFIVSIERMKFSITARKDRGQRVRLIIRCTRR
jgi:hypothetical protein